MARSPLRQVAPAAQHDPYALDDANYDVNKIITKMGENQVTVRGRVDASIAGRIAKLVEQRVFPEYATQSDFIRDALHHRLAWAESQHPDPALYRVLNTQTLLNDMAKRDERMDAERMVVDRAKATFEKALGARDKVMFDEHMEQCITATEGMVGQYQHDLRTLIRSMKAQEKKVAW